ncbi:uncharacterized protein LDX57_005204 [Aspergillus melleus]|uniref:uncharacterized protein n=1 Tax=Aspergillus melleus TaxID=138277 RepID=UPI001E8DD534|nr:uncharacterized protein LDX57_005204 [Aspergillus melleus]KAH8427491.1 hypothetical protein LDX57_005204 [Aspergillus melleus]
MPSAFPQAGMGKLMWSTGEIPYMDTLRCPCKAAAPIAGTVDSNSIDLPLMSSNPDSSARASPVSNGGTKAGTKAGSRECSACSRPCKPSGEAYHATPIECDWADCTYTGTFSCKAELKRHVETQHIYPGSHECPEPKCDRAFKRRDNLKEHVRRAQY